LLLKAAHLPQHASRLCDQLTHVVTSYLPHVTWEKRADFDERAARLLPALLLARIDGKSPVEYLTDSKRHAVRTIARAWLREPQPSLACLSSAWRDWVARHLSGGNI
jgi:hypothetical protein